VRNKITRCLSPLGVAKQGRHHVGTGTWIGDSNTLAEICNVQRVLGEILAGNPNHYPRSHPPVGWEVDHVWVYIEDAI